MSNFNQENFMWIEKRKIGAIFSCVTQQNYLQKPINKLCINNRLWESSPFYATNIYGLKVFGFLNIKVPEKCWVHVHTFIVYFHSLQHLTSDICMLRISHHNFIQHVRWGLESNYNTRHQLQFYGPRPIHRNHINLEWTNTNLFSLQ